MELFSHLYFTQSYLNRKRLESSFLINARFHLKTNKHLFNDHTDKTHIPYHKHYHYHPLEYLHLHTYTRIEFKNPIFKRSLHIECLDHHDMINYEPSATVDKPDAENLEKIALLRLRSQQGKHPAASVDLHQSDIDELESADIMIMSLNV